VVASYLFDGYGVRKVASSDPTAPQDPYSGYGGLAGYYTDWETGLSLLGFRYYDVLAGRFLTRDPIGFAGGINLYEYVGNSPVQNQDRLGLWDWSGFWECAKEVPTLLGSAGACVGALEGVLLGKNGSAGEAFCKLAVSCVSGFLCSFAARCSYVVRFGGAPTVIASCAISAICSFVQSVVTEFCSAKTCWGTWKRWWSKNWGCLLFKAAISCITGVAGLPEDWIKNWYKRLLPWLYVQLHLKLPGTMAGLLCTYAPESS
jgi:RHS repeat-associated protein